MLTKELFDEHLNTVFKVEVAQDQYVELLLIKCKESRAIGIESFTLIFEGPANQVLWDNTYKFSHDKIGNFNLFISPYRQDKDKIYYDVQFTRLLEE